MCSGRGVFKNVCSARGLSQRRVCSGNDAVRKCVPGRVSVRSACVRRGVAVRKKMCPTVSRRLVSCCCVVGVPRVSRRMLWFVVSNSEFD